MTTTRHPPWCAQGHHCGLGEHRADPITITTPGIGSAVLTRVQTTTGRPCAEVRLSILLPTAEPEARRRLTGLLTDLHTIISPPRRSHRTATARPSWRDLP